MSTNRYQAVDPVLTNVAIAYENDEYVADRLFPTIPVDKQSGQHYVYDQGRFRTSKNYGVRAPGANAEEVRHNITTGSSYFCEDHAKKELVLDEDVANARNTGRDPFADATENVRERLIVDREVELTTVLTTAASYASSNKATLTGTAQWDDYASSNPIGNIRTGKAAIHSAIFKEANLLVLSRDSYDIIVDHPDFLERIKYSQAGVTTEEIIARIVGVDEVIVAKAGKNTAAEGQTDSMSYIWGNFALLAYVDPNPRPKYITLGLNYQWTGPSGNMMVTERLRGTDEQDRRGTFVRVGDDYRDDKLVSALCGYLITNPISG